MLGDFSSRCQPVYWVSASQALLDTLRPVAGDQLRVITDPEELIEQELSSDEQDPSKGVPNTSEPTLGSIICSEKNTRNA